MNKKEKLVNKLAGKKAKIAAKLGKGQTAASIRKAAGKAVLAALCFLAFGCATQPSRSQTQTIKGCQFYVMVPATPAAAAPADASGLTPGAAALAAAATGRTAEAVPVTVGDILSQNMMIENSGTENNSQQHTVSPTTTIPVNVGAGGGESLAGILGTLKTMVGGNSAGAADSAAAKAAAAACAADGTCADPAMP